MPGLPQQPYPPIWVLTHPDLANVPRVREFMRFAADALAARAGFHRGEPGSA